MAYNAALIILRDYMSSDLVMSNAEVEGSSPFPGTITSDVEREFCVYCKSEKAKEKEWDKNHQAYIKCFNMVDWANSFYKTLDNVEGLEFILGIDKKLHGKAEGRYLSTKYTYDTYADKSMTASEIEKVLEISKKSGLVIYPINTSHGFAVGFQVSKIKRGFTENKLLTFRESQLPSGYSFKTLSEYFMKPFNRIKARMIGEKIRGDYGYYDY